MEYWPIHPSRAMPGVEDLSEPAAHEVWELPEATVGLDIKPEDVDDLSLLNIDLQSVPDGLSDQGHLSADSQKAGRAPRKRPYKPRTGNARLKNMETQRRYRERLKAKAAETEAAYAATAAELEKARAEQAALWDQSRALELLRQGSESMISLLRSAATGAGNMAASAASTIISLSGDVFGMMWSKGIRPSESHIRFFARYVDRIPPAFNANFAIRLIDSLDHWRSSPPAGRQAIERKLAAVYDTRLRILAIVYKDFPEKAEYVVRAGTEIGAACQKMERMDVLCDPDILEVVAMTEEQETVLRGHWESYAARFCDSKGMVAEAVNKVQAASDTFVSEVNSLRGMVRRNTDAQQGAAAAEAFIAEERMARIKLMIAAQTMLSPLQLAWYQLVAMRLLPSPDIVPMMKYILSNHQRSPAPQELLRAASATDQTIGAVTEVFDQGSA